MVLGILPHCQWIRHSRCLPHSCYLLADSVQPAVFLALQKWPTLTLPVPVLSSGVFQLWRVSDPLQPHPGWFFSDLDVVGGTYRPACALLLSNPTLFWVSPAMFQQPHVLALWCFATPSIRTVGPWVTWVWAASPLTHTYFFQLTFSVQTHLFKGQLAV